MASRKRASPAQDYYQSILFQGDFPASHSLMLASVKAKPTRATSGAKWRVWLATLSQSGSWERMLADFSQSAWNGESITATSAIFSETWPAWGMQVAGVCYRLPTPERH